MGIDNPSCIAQIQTSARNRKQVGSGLSLQGRGIGDQ